MAPRSKDAIYSGYLMSVNHFKQFLATLKVRYANGPLLNHIAAYDFWRGDLPQADRAKVPKLRCTCHHLHVSFDPDVFSQ
jgi:hypothetical protein